MNGKIKVKEVSDASFDGDGNPVIASVIFGAEIDCKYEATIPNRTDVVDVGDGAFQIASWIITVRDMKFNGKIIQLINSRNEIVCEKDVKSLEVLEKIKRVKIVV